ncbi:MAG: DUF1838 domain-containing protein [Chitinophagaceae bacterium]|nr:DUF1838 domain-containing protein [Chitinophagaceae bacterium]
MKNGFVALCLLISAFCYAQKKLNLDSARDNLDAYIKMRVSLDSNEHPVFYNAGKIYAYEPDKPWKHLFDFEMFNIARAVKMPGDSGYYLLTRELLVYKDPKTGKILDEWVNPWTNEKVEVFHVWNDPVNQIFRYGKFFCEFQKQNGRISLYNDVPLHYPSPLHPAEWPENSRSEWYQGAEMFNFFCHEKDLVNAKVKNVMPVQISWTRFGDFLPWMKMGKRPGNLLYHGRGYKLKSFQDLPAHLKDYVMKNHPEYSKAPQKYSSPNMTSWRYYKKVMEERKKRNTP